MYNVKGDELLLLIWLAKELVCLRIENQTEIHCYARVQTEMLLERAEKEQEKQVEFCCVFDHNMGL